MIASATNMQTWKAADGMDGAQAPRLSTDFLNRFSEALMLIELAATDDSIVEDLQAWRSVGYREHFEASSLRCAAAALAAYNGVEPGRREAFEQVCQSMTRLVMTVNALLVEMPRPSELPVIIDVASEALRKLISRSAQFINANGTVDIAAFDDLALQRQIDGLLAR